MAWQLRRRTPDPAEATAQEREREAAERKRQERAAREARRQQAAARRRQVAGELAAAALSWGLTAWLEGAMWFCLAGGLAVDYIGSYADLAATFGAFGYDDWVRWIMPLGIDLPVTASVLGQMLAGRWKCGWWVRVRLGILTAITAPLTLVGNALRGVIDANGHFVNSFHVALWMDLAAFAVPGLGVVLIGWVASMMQGERAELTRQRLEGEAEAMAAEMAGGADPEPDGERGADVAGPVAVGTTISMAGDDRTDDRESVTAPAIERPPIAVMTAGGEAGDREVAAPVSSANGHDPAGAAVTQRPPAATGAGHEAVMTGRTSTAIERPPNGRPARDEVDRGAATPVAAVEAVMHPPGDPAAGHEDGHRAATEAVGPTTASGLADGRDDDQQTAAVMTAEEAKAAAVRLVRQARRGGRPVTAADIERVTGRKARQARRLLAQAKAAATDDSPAGRLRGLTSLAAVAGAAAEREA